jgi:hypothetical protein
MNRCLLPQLVAGFGGGRYSGIEMMSGAGFAAHRNYLCRFWRFLGMTRASGIAARRTGNEVPAVAGSGRGSDLAVVPEIDHRVGEGLERIVHPADALKAQQ